MMAKTHYGNCDAPVNHRSTDILTPILSLKAWSRDTFSGIYLNKYRHLFVNKIAYALFIMEKNTQFQSWITLLSSECLAEVR